MSQSIFLHIVQKFKGASSFNHDINEWDVSQVTDMEEMVSPCTLLPLFSFKCRMYMANRTAPLTNVSESMP